MGSTVFGAYDSLTSYFPPGAITPYGVHYPAVSILPDGFDWSSVGDALNGLGALTHIKPVGGYTDSVRDGTADTQREIETTHAACPTTRFILSGHSQGAQAVGDAIQRMPDADRNLVVAAAFFGDSYFNSDSWSSRSTYSSGHYGLLGSRDEWPAQFHGFLFSYCHKHDPVCNGDKRISALGASVDVRDPVGWDFGQHTNYATGPDHAAADAALRVARALGGTGTTTAGTAPLDLVFCIDSTGSMSGEISDVQQNVIALANTIAANSTTYRFGLVDYKDDPDDDSPYQAQVDVPFTTDTGAFTDGVSSLTAEGGGDLPESVYSGVMTALNMPWRVGVKKAVIVIGDAPGKDPEPVTGYTLSDVVSKALAVDPAEVYAVPVGGAQDAIDFQTALSQATGGTTTTADDPATFISSLQSAIGDVGSSPVADAGGPYVEVAGQSVLLSAAATNDAGDPVVGYDWNFGDGAATGYDTSTADPQVRHSYTSPGTYTVTVRARTQHDLSGIAQSTVTVTDAPASPPGTPTGLTAQAAPESAALTWSRGAGPAPDFYEVQDGSGAVIDQFVAPTSDSVRWTDPDLPDGTTRTYRVLAGSTAGLSAPSVTVAVTPTPAAAPTPIPPIPPAPPAATSPPAPGADRTALSKAGTISVAYGKRVTLTVTATDAETSAKLGQAPLYLFERANPKMGWHLIGSAATNAAGRASRSVKVTANGQYQWRYPGSVAHLPVTGPIRSVRALEVLSVSAKVTSAYPGKTITLWGSVRPAMAHQYAQLQIQIAGRWRSIARSRISSRRMPGGHHAIGFLFTVVKSQHGRYRFRVLGPKSSTLVSGTSRTVTLRW